MGGNKSKNDAETVCFSFTGTGLIAALEGWESRLYEFIKARAPETKITRCDIAHDFLDGEGKDGKWKDTREDGKPKDQQKD